MKKEWINLDTNMIKPRTLILMNYEEFKIQMTENAEFIVIQWTKGSCRYIKIETIVIQNPERHNEEAITLSAVYEFFVAPVAVSLDSSATKNKSIFDNNNCQNISQLI